MKAHVRDEMFQKQYSEVFQGDAELAQTEVGRRARSSNGTTPRLTSSAAVLRRDGRSQRADRGFDGMRVLAMLGDSVTTDHISPAGSIPVDARRASI